MCARGWLLQLAPAFVDDTNAHAVPEDEPKAHAVPFPDTAFRYKGKQFQADRTVKDLQVPAKDARGVKVTVMHGARREKGPDPLGQRKAADTP